MTGIIPEDEDELEQEVYDDVGAIDEDIYEELPGNSTHYITVTICIIDMLPYRTWRHWMHLFGIVYFPVIAYFPVHLLDRVL